MEAALGQGDPHDVTERCKTLGLRKEKDASIKSVFFGDGG